MNVFLLIQVESMLLKVPEAINRWYIGNPSSDNAY